MHTHVLSFLRSTALLACAFATQAQAETITIAVEAKVTSINDSHGYLTGKIGVGDRIAGTYTYDTALPDLVPEDPYWGFYIHTLPGYGFDLRVNGFRFRSDPGDPWFTMAVAPDIPELGLNHAFSIINSSKNVFDLSAPGEGEFYQWIELGLSDRSIPLTLSDDAMPKIAPATQRWDSGILQLYSRRGDLSNRFSVNAQVTRTRKLSVCKPLTECIRVSPKP